MRERDNVNGGPENRRWPGKVGPMLAWSVSKAWQRTSASLSMAPSCRLFMDSKQGYKQHQPFSMKPLCLCGLVLTLFRQTRQKLSTPSAALNVERLEFQAEPPKPWT